MQLIGNDLNSIADLAYETSLALEEAEAKALAKGDMNAADAFAKARQILDAAMYRLWADKRHELLLPEHTGAIIAALKAAVSTTKSAAANLGSFGEVLNAISKVNSLIGRVVELFA